jgi:hypothetical protein
MALLSSLDVLAGFTCVAVPVPHMANAETAERLLDAVPGVAQPTTLLR